ncbi:MAG: tRNA (adenosine(37)-N6)-threonylcarbamoyltransferase complex ATPase subunit type 1 TsaE [Anaerolineae bacterium]|nr:tRNA (adenosine(37)-N6)-threonylcarbamoyltransferase complex ATPase subunit type 1 TsaE [Anaerolineae bacterium]
MSPIFSDTTFDFVSNSVEQTRRLGARLGALLTSGHVICLSGGLGAGKTQMAAGIAGGWDALEPVSSPTFVLVHEHTRAADAMRLYHIDCYRIGGPEELGTLGWEDMLDANAALVIEWPERIDAALPAGHLWITFSGVEDESFTRRRLLFEAAGDPHNALLSEFRRRAFGSMPE